MATTSWERLHLLVHTWATDLSCPKCGSEPARPCLDQRKGFEGREVKRIHYDRFEAAANILERIAHDYERGQP